MRTLSIYDISIAHSSQHCWLSSLAPQHKRWCTFSSRCAIQHRERDILVHFGQFWCIGPTCGCPSLTPSTAKVQREEGKENRRGRRGGKGNQTFLLFITNMKFTWKQIRKVLVSYKVRILQLIRLKLNHNAVLIRHSQFPYRIYILGTHRVERRCIGAKKIFIFMWFHEFMNLSKSCLDFYPLKLTLLVPWYLK